MGLIKSQMKPASAILLLSANFGLGSIASYKSCEYHINECTAYYNFKDEIKVLGSARGNHLRTYWLSMGRFFYFSKRLLESTQ